jgi:hypothetical protein
VRDRNRYRRFSNATRPYDADKSPGRDLRTQDVDSFVAANHSQRRRGKNNTFDEGSDAATPDRCNKAIAPSGNVGDVAPRLAIAERFSERGNMDPKTGLLDNDVRPDPLDQVSVANDLPCAVDQSNQDVESTAAQRHRLTLVHQQSLGGDQAKRAKLEYFSVVYSRLQGSNLSFHVVHIASPVGAGVHNLANR